MRKLLAIAFVGMFATAIIGGCRAEVDPDMQSVVAPAR